MEPVGALLLELARLHGVETVYRDSRGHPREATARALTGVLQALGADLGDFVARGHEGGTPKDSALKRAILSRRLEIWQRILEPVTVAWDGLWPTIGLRLPDRVVTRGAAVPFRDGCDRHLMVELALEEGESLRAEVDLLALPAHQQVSIAKGRFSEYGLPLNLLGSSRSSLPLGWHELRVEFGSERTTSTLISAPSRAWSPESMADRAAHADGSRTRPWGVFAPLYALRSDRNWGVGDLTDLAALQRWTHDRGGEVVATLPLLATYLDRPFEPSPYRPVSRLFWDEVFLDVESLVLSASCAAAHEVMSSAAFQRESAELRAMPTVDYRRVMALKRMVLEELAHYFFASPDSKGHASLEAFVRDNPEVDGYARFRAATEKSGIDWREWPDSRRHRPPQWGEFDESARRYHLFCQWQMEEQLAALSGGAARGERGYETTPHRVAPTAGLFLDMPLGVHPGGYDTWRWPSLFVDGVTGGAPPDDFFSLGQNWDFFPLHPERIRDDGHRYFAASVRQQMRHARYLRLDHVMSLHRLFWVPEGSRPQDGAYVGYPAEELYAVLCLESRRYRTVLVGEDLGTVPPEVHPAMRRHRLSRTWVLQSSLRRSSKDPVGKVPPYAVASVNTHDMFPFAGFLMGEDIVARVAKNQLAAPLARKEVRRRAQLVSGLADLLRGLGLLSPLQYTEVMIWLAANTAARSGPMDRSGESSGTPGAAQIEGKPFPAEIPGSSVPDCAGIEAMTEPVTAPAALLAAALTYIAQSRAALTVLNLEDLWLETRPQNQPGTGSECPNWCRKSTLGIDLGELGRPGGSGRTVLAALAGAPLAARTPPGGH